MTGINPGDKAKRNPIPSKPWRVCGSNPLHEDYPSKAAAYDAVRELNGWGHTAIVYTWIEGVWVLYEVVVPAAREADLMATEPRKDDR